MHRQRLLLVLVVGELAVAALVLHIPDIGAASGFLGGGYATGVGVVAASALLIWVALMVSCVVLLVRTLRHVPATVRAARLTVALMIAVSIAVLCLGVVRHATGSYSMCCGSISQARQQLANAP